jgi:hypothetical protein
MFFLVDNVRKIMFGWTGKCGCSHVKRLFWFLQNNKIDNPIHTSDDIQELPDDIVKYTTIIIGRNPYKRIISGFLDKYRSAVGGEPQGEYRDLWTYDTITFSMFTDELLQNDWKMVNYHHFTPQLSDAFDEKILESKCIKCYDIANIDYKYIEKLYNIKIPEIILYKIEGHERGKYELDFDSPVYDLNIDEYYNYNVDIKHFFNEELKQKIFKFYEKDFLFFSEYEIDYNLDVSNTDYSSNNINAIAECEIDCNVDVLNTDCSSNNINAIAEYEIDYNLDVLNTDYSSNNINAIAECEIDCNVDVLNTDCSSNNINAIAEYEIDYNLDVLNTDYSSNNINAIAE